MVIFIIIAFSLFLNWLPYWYFLSLYSPFTSTCIPTIIFIFNLFLKNFIQCISYHIHFYPLLPGHPASLPIPFHVLSLKIKKKLKEEKHPLKSMESDLCWTSDCEHGFCLESCWYTQDNSVKENRFSLCQVLSFMNSFWLGLGVCTHLPSFEPGFCPSWACLMHAFIVPVNSYRYLPFGICLLKITITSDSYNLSTPSSA